ncbi:MAG: sensor histidine kinase, partial [Anaerolineales bacterium]|nr:sensor histidine kinase [Anaerolineales bacterium]
LCCTHLHLPDCHITIPIEARDEKLGIINLLCTQSYALNEEDLDLLAAIGSQVSEIVANAWLRMKLAEKEEARQALLESLVVAQEDERGRLARELHDGAGQMLTNLLVRIKALEKRTESSDMQQGLETLLDITSETIDQVRDLSYRLRPAALEEFGLSVALQILVDDMVDGLPIEAACNFDLEETALPASIEVTLYRIAQEGLTNILRHANASHIDVELVWENHGVKMCIEDDGCGFAPHYLAATPGVRHLGLISMRERAAMVGGSLELFSAPGKGTTLLVHVPVFEAVDQ